MSKYWCEGSKTDNTSSFVFVNSDPQMVLVVKKFLLSVWEIPLEDITFRIQINLIHKNRINRVLNFWRNLLKLREDQIKLPYFIKTKVRKVYENHDDYYGVCRLIIKRSGFLKYRMNGLIRALKSIILPA